MNIVTINYLKNRGVVYKTHKGSSQNNFIADLINLNKHQPLLLSFTLAMLFSLKGKLRQLSGS